MDILQMATTKLHHSDIETTQLRSRDSSEPSSRTHSQDLNDNSDMNSSDDENNFRIVKKCNKQFQNSSSDEEIVNQSNSLTNSDDQSSNVDSDIPRTETVRKTRIKQISDSNSNISSDDELLPRKNVLPKRNRKKKLYDRFKHLNSKSKKSNLIKIIKDSDCNNSDQVVSNFEVDQKPTENMSPTTLLVCDPDESDEEDTDSIQIKKIIGPKSKSSMPKQVRISAKEAMANMKKIKSESNRMLREKEVSLPYHRPKTLSLKDIMSRRRPALTNDGKSLPIKMNKEQLTHYALMLEQRQKEMIELCKSDTDEENEEVIDTHLKKESNLLNNGDGNKSNTEENLPDNTFQNKDQNMADASEMSFDQIVNESRNISNKSKEHIKSVVNAEHEADIKTGNEIKNKNISEYLINVSDMNVDEHESETKNSANGSSNSRSIIQNTDKEIKYSNKKDENVSIINSFDKVEIQGNETNYQKNTDNSQMILLHYDSETINLESNYEEKELLDTISIKNQNVSAKSNEFDIFSDSELNDIGIDALIETTEIVTDDRKRNINIANTKPKLTGTPGMIIRLDDHDESVVKPSGIELLKEKFSYFAKLQNEEDMENDREKRFKPGTQYVKLKQQLENEIAEQRSLEWAKRLEEERLLKLEQNTILGDDSIEDIDKIDDKLEVLDNKKRKVNDTSESDEDDEDAGLIEDDIDMTDKPGNRNPMIEDEAEESGDNDRIHTEKDDVEVSDNEKINSDNGGKDRNYDEVDSESSDSSDSEDVLQESMRKKGRILKAFEDSDDEEAIDIGAEDTNIKENHLVLNNKVEMFNEDKISQDDDLQLAQANKSMSEEMFTSQESSYNVVPLNKNNEEMTSGDLGTFSILNTNISKPEEKDPENNVFDKLPDIGDTQPDVNFDEIAGMCSGSFTQNIVIPTQKSQLTPSLELGDDVAALCTGKFYDNRFISQNNVIDTGSQDIASLETETIENPMLLNKEYSEKNFDKHNTQIDDKVANNLVADTKAIAKKSEENALLKSILDELDEPQLDKLKQYKFFTPPTENVKKKLIIDSDDETEDDDEKSKTKRKRKLEKRALQISDDEEEEVTSDLDEYNSDDEEGDVVDKVYEYDSEENEVEVLEKPKKKKRVGEFFENEAELTSEDEWVGSGDEDEAGLDRMEREEGDNEVFHEGKLQRELGKIHMREVLDQDKREVRLIQELLFEDADLGDGHRQRKFRWKNIDGQEESGSVVDEFGETQEEEFESEEMWRKQRHEREMFLRKMQANGEEDLNTSINRSTIIKANLASKTMSNLIAETKHSPVEKKNIVVSEKNSSKDIPSPKKPFAIFKQNYHGSLLTRGRGALARLAALATPLVVDDDAPKLLAATRGNFVFTARNDEEPKVKKRKAETNVNTPQLMKKIKTEEYKKTLFERLRE